LAKGDQDASVLDNFSESILMTSGTSSTGQETAALPGCFGFQQSAAIESLSPQLQALLIPLARASSTISEQLTLQYPFLLAPLAARLKPDLDLVPSLGAAAKGKPTMAECTTNGDAEELHAANSGTADKTALSELGNIASAGSLDVLLDKSLKERFLLAAQLLLSEQQREKEALLHEREMLLKQNNELRRENVLLRNILASSTVLAGLSATAKGTVS
uniref:BZIP domain-containing protein n=1 Tax=Gongylonema pulchrum TaxID=637853 RepID=A0A183E1Z7_9BILA